MIIIEVALGIILAPFLFYFLIKLLTNIHWIIIGIIGIIILASIIRNQELFIVLFIFGLIFAAPCILFQKFYLDKRKK